MSAAVGFLPALVSGAALGLQFNPVTAVVSAVAAALLAGYSTAPDSRRPLAVGVLALAWVAGDGARIGRVLDTAPGDGTLWVAVAAWILVGALVGYALPAAAGIGVGRRVVRGTGWLSAGAVAFTIAGALSVTGPAVADGLRGMAGLA